MHYIFAKKDPELADIFFDGLYSGYDLPSSSPIFVLRERLLKEQIAKGKRGKATVSQETILHWAIKTWNFLRAGETTNLIKIGPKEVRPEIQ